MTPDRASSVPWWKPLAWGGCCSVFWAVAFAALSGDTAWSQLGLVALIPVIFTARLALPGGPAVRGRFWLGALLFGLGHVPAIGLAHAYIWTTAAPAYPLLLLYLAAFPALSVYLTARVRRRWPRLPFPLVFPLIWVALEVVRGEWLLGGYPWYLLGHALTRRGELTWLAPLVGAYGCSFLLAAAASVPASAHRSPSPRVRAYVFVGLVLLVLVAAPFPAARPIAVRRFGLAILQTNLPQDNKLGWSLQDRVEAHQRWLAQSRRAAEQVPRPELVVWPETMFPGYALNPEAVEAQRRAGLSYGRDGDRLAASWFADSLAQSQASTKVPYLVGAIAADNLRYEPGDAGSVKTLLDARTNSAVLVFDGRSESARYDKVDLMAFGEYIPLVWRWPAAQRWLTGIGAHGMAFDLAFGKGRPLFNIAGVRTGTPICFEVCHQSSCREFTTAQGRRRADLLVNLTNDGWFYDSDFNRRMHLLQARWRCAEFGTPMVRAANTGISCIVGATGAVETRSLDGGGPLARAEGIITGEVQLADPQAPATFFATTGYWFAPASAVLGLIMASLGFWPSRRSNGRTPAASAA